MDHDASQGENETATRSRGRFVGQDHRGAIDHRPVFIDAEILELNCTVKLFGACV